MKKFFAGLFIAVLCIAFIVLAYAEEESAPCYTPVLMDWDAKDGKDLEQKILEYWRTNAPGWEAGLYLSLIHIQMCIRDSRRDDQKKDQQTEDNPFDFATHIILPLPNGFF